MPAILPSKGCLYVHRKAGARGSFSLSPSVSSTVLSPVLVQGAQIGLKESHFKVNTLRNTRFLYSFGSQMGDIVVPLALLLGKFDATEEQRAWNALLDYYARYRLSATNQPITISMPGASSARFFLVGVNMSPPNPQNNVADASLFGVLVDSGK